MGSTATPAASLQATWFDGRSAQPQPCEISFDAALGAAPNKPDLLLTSPNLTVKRYTQASVVWPERTRHGKRQLLLPDGGVVSLPDSQAWDQWAQAAGLAQPLAARWALSWRGVVAASCLLVVVGLGAWRWGIPWGAQALALWVPDRVPAALGQRVLADLHDRRWLSPSELPPEAQQRIQDAVADMVRRGYKGPGGAPKYQLHLRKAAHWLGPNAMALPSGDVVVTDALVTMLQTDSATVSPALLGVVAHELGHLRQRHGMRALFEFGAISALTGWWLGDYSTLLAATPALFAQASYSRDHERAADAEAALLMRAAGINPRVMVDFFSKAQQAKGVSSGDTPRLGLASHPPSEERVRFFEQAAYP
jgi:Zn-dependent protease with chaperone function